MPEKYVIHTREVEDRFKPISKSGVIAWEEGCLKCPVCVKTKCVYRVYDKRGIDARQMIESIDNLCMNCFRCIQSCPKELIHKSLNPEFKSIGDHYWQPDIIARLWYQARTGKIPVSGAGYPGPFSGPGFDSMWTDMSEIVRPTRDGIHGREYISTMVDIGRKPQYLQFGESGDIKGEEPKIISIPLPIILRIPDFGNIGDKTLEGFAMAGMKLGTIFSLPFSMINDELKRFGSILIPYLTETDYRKYHLPEDMPAVELEWFDGIEDEIHEIMDKNLKRILSIKIPITSDVEHRVLSLVDKGAYMFHLYGTWDGQWMDNEKKYLRDGIRRIHLKLVDLGIRDELTLIASGGIAMAEHVAKAIICGADALMVDFPILIALECRMCRRCTKGLSCPVDISEAEPPWVARRVINLMGAWHNQLLEVMGAMGMRDARRLRGEAGRSMFFEELDKETFSSLNKIQIQGEVELE